MEFVLLHWRPQNVPRQAPPTTERPRGRPRKLALPRHGNFPASRTELDSCLVSGGCPGSAAQKASADSPALTQGLGHGLSIS